MASLGTIFKQVEREGRRWGLFPVMKDGKVKVCENVYELPTRKDAPKIPQLSARTVCSLDENSPLDAFNAVLVHRMKRHAQDYHRQMMDSQLRKKAEEQAAVNDQRKQFRNFLARSKNRVMTHGKGGLIMPDGSAVAWQTARVPNVKG